MKFKNVLLVILLMGFSFGAGSAVVFYYSSHNLASGHLTVTKVLIRTQKDLDNQNIENVENNLSILIEGSIRALETIDSIFPLPDGYKKELEEIHLHNKAQVSKG